MSASLYLSQSYKDTWDDYQRSIQSPAFPVWDYVILTASNKHQAHSFELRLHELQPYLPSRTRFAVIPDEGDVRVGSGGATLSVIKWIKEQNNDFSGLRVLVIHSGGDSKRIPQYSAIGKLFSPVPHVLPDGRSSTLFDEILIVMTTVAGRIREGMLLLSGDVLLLFNPLLIDWNGKGAACISFKEEANTGKNHGVFLRGEDGYVKAFLHKQNVETLRCIGAVNEAGAVDIDTGAVLLGVDVLNTLFSLISTDGILDKKKYAAFVNNRVRLSLYGDFYFPFAANSTLEQFLVEKPEGEFSSELTECRKAIWAALRPYRMKLLRLAPAQFIHFGTTREILALMTGKVEQYKELGWNGQTNSSIECSAGYNSVLSTHASIGKGCYFEVSYIGGCAVIEEGCVLSYINIDEPICIPAHTVLHGLKLNNGSFVCRIYGVEDDPKENKLFGVDLNSLHAMLWNDGEPHSLWTARLYPERRSFREAIYSALELYQAVTSGGEIESGISLEESFKEADIEAVLAWNKRMNELVAMNAVASHVENHVPVSQIKQMPPLSKFQREWLETRASSAGYSEAMRLHYYFGTALKDEKEIAKSFSVLQRAILNALPGSRKKCVNARIARNNHEVRLPLRVNWGGGWSDTPPYCNENGGTVLNAAILINGERPVRVTLHKLAEKKIVFESRDMDVHGEFTALNQLQSVGDPFDPFVLQKALLLACGVLPPAGGNLDDILESLGGGIWIDTEVVNVPNGSGLGSSSILAAACVKALFEFLAIPYTEADIYSTVLCMEQIMSTGGGWQDQVGGLTDGIKYATSRAGLTQSVQVDQVKLDEQTMAELNERFALVYTGQRRLARNILREVVGRYIGNEPYIIYALNEIQRIAVLMRFELERGNVDAFAKLLNEHWELSKTIDAGSTNTLIDQIFDSVDDLLSGRMICGAGGGGFVQVVLKKGMTNEQLHARLKSVFMDTDIDVWNVKIE